MNTPPEQEPLTLDDYDREEIVNAASSLIADFDDFTHHQVADGTWYVLDEDDTTLIHEARALVHRLTLATARLTVALDNAGH
ncbi:hypothetical protein [Streptomyces noursei]|uniref:hypothetical protein n=1 Tax=Streptomyces noursei TaxID=1971 RepID=UPI0023B7E792|nr:hypothetical protein [Streptomyces noursei]